MATLRVTVKVGGDTAVAATGSITTVAAAALVDGETFTLGDGVNPPVVFEFDDDASVVENDQLRAVVFAAETADQMKTAIINAITAAPALDITATSGGVGIVTLTADNAGFAANFTIAETVVDGGFAVTGMSGGEDASTDSDRRRIWMFTAANGTSIVGNVRAKLSQSSYAYDLNGPKIPNTISVTSYSPALFDSGDLAGQDALVDQISDAIEAGKIDVVDNAAPSVLLARGDLEAYL